jgi:hypothetical protein
MHVDPLSRFVNLKQLLTKSDAFHWPWVKALKHLAIYMLARADGSSARTLTHPKTSPSWDIGDIGELDGAPLMKAPLRPGPALCRPCIPCGSSHEIWKINKGHKHRKTGFCHYIRLTAAAAARRMCSLRTAP